MATSALLKQLNETGRLPGIKLLIQPLDSARKSIELIEFTSYNFQNSILIPVDTFSFSFVSPSLEPNKSFLDYVQEGDVAILKCNTPQGEKTISTGIIDVIDIETTDSGEICTVQGRDFLAQLEDQTCVNLNANPLPFGNYNAKQVLNYLLGNTRIKKYAFQNYNGSTTGFFACDPGETKLSALLRYCEALNALVWSGPDGTLNFGKPNMQEDPRGQFILDKFKRFSNVLGMKSVRASTSIPNVVMPIWNGQEYVTARIAADSAFCNIAEGPKRLATRGHVVLKVVSSSIPSGGDSTSQSQLTTQKNATAAGSTFMQAIAKREVARENLKELDVQVITPGHYNEKLEALIADTCYQIIYPSAKVDERMYCYAVTYEMNAENGARSRLSFCKLGTIVADNGFQILEQGLPNKASPV